MATKTKGEKIQATEDGDMSDAALAKSMNVSISAPNFQTAVMRIKGTAPYVQLQFGAKARGIMRAKQAAGSTAKKGVKREAKDFDAAFEEAQHRDTEGFCGIPAGGLRRALIDACSITGFKMTLAKKSLFIEADTYDAVEGTPLVRIYQPSRREGAEGELVPAEPKHVEHMVRNATGVADIRVRAMYDADWEATVRVRFDADIFTPTDIANLMMRAGLQIGIGEGRPNSKNSAGMGWGTFECVQSDE